MLTGTHNLNTKDWRVHMEYSKRPTQRKNKRKIFRYILGHSFSNQWAVKIYIHKTLMLFCDHVSEYNSFNFLAEKPNVCGRFGFLGSTFLG